MAFPPEFSSTLKYANRYDLDEIDVLFQGEANNSLYFSLNGLPTQLSFGKHFFNIAILNSFNLDYQLIESSRILFEFKSSNNIVLRSDVTNINQKNGLATCFVEVLRDPLRTLKEINDGFGTLNVVASLENKSGRGNTIPEKFKGAMNYRCTFPIEIRKNLIGANSPITTNIQHERKTINGQFSFIGANIGAPINSEQGIEYGTDGTPGTGTNVSAIVGSPD